MSSWAQPGGGNNSMYSGGNSSMYSGHPTPPSASTHPHHTHHRRTPSGPAPAQGAFDFYGFPLRDLAPEDVEVRARCAEAAVRREKKWRGVHVDPLKGVTGVREAALKAMVRKGVPATLRAEIWPAVSGARELQRAHPPGYYRGLEGHAAADHVRQIDLDMPRTFPAHPRFQLGQPELTALRRILCSYAARNTKLGYTQGMNFLGGMILLGVGVQREEDAFWILCALIERILYKGLFSDRLEGLQVELQVLEELLRIKVPKCWAHCESVGVSAALIAMDWFITAFTKTMPSETVMRVLDAMLNEGSKIIFRVGLAVFFIEEERIRASRGIERVVELVVQRIANAHDRDLLMKTAFDDIGSLSMSTIDEMRARAAGEVHAKNAGRR